MVSVAGVISAISDKITLSIFKSIALSENYNVKTLMANLRLTREECYWRMEKLMRAGLVKRIRGRYYTITSLGKVIFAMVVKIETAINYYWKLKAIDSVIMMSTVYGKELPVQECQKIMDNIIDNQEIKAILLLSMFDSQTCASVEEQQQQKQIC
jgi:predicted transcriptional regulator